MEEATKREKVHCSHTVASSAVLSTWTYHKIHPDTFHVFFFLLHHANLTPTISFSQTSKTVALLYFIHLSPLSQTFVSDLTGVHPDHLMDLLLLKKP